MIDLHAKFEVSRYEDMKDNENVEIWGGFGLEVTQGHRLCHHSVQRKRFLIQL